MRAWLGWAVAWVALSCLLLFVAHGVWPHSALMGALVVGIAYMGAWVIGDRARRGFWLWQIEERRAAGPGPRRSAVAAIFVPVVLFATISTLFVALPPMSAFTK